MKKVLCKKNLKYILPLLAVLAVMVILVFVLSGNDDRREVQKHKYFLTLDFDAESKTLSGREEVFYINSSENMFETIYFHLYPNAFRENSKAEVVSQANFDKAYPNGISYSNIEIFSVKSLDRDLEYSIEGEDENILAVKLPQAIYPNENVVVDIEFVVKLANVNHRLGYGKNTINFGNFYPIACVYEDGVGFSKSLYDPNGDPFYSKCADYEVKISFDEAFDIASSGELSQSSIDQNRITNTYKAQNIRDFAFVLSNKFICKSDEVDGIKVNYFGYVIDENLNRCLNTSICAIKTFNEMFGKYPYPQISIVKSNFVHGGMEYPNLVLISDDLSDEKDIDYVIVHELAHQWWYGVVGNDEYNHAWIDEGLAEFSTLLFFEKNTEFDIDFKNTLKNVTNSYALFEEVFTKVTGSVNGVMDRPLNEFETEPEYVQCTYSKAVLMFNTLRDVVGNKKFVKALKSVYDKYQFEIITPSQLIAEFAKYGGNSIEGIFDSFLQGKVIIKRIN